MTDSMERWQGKVALVTGASSGIGQALARRLRAEGMKLVLCARRLERLAQLQSALGSADTLALHADLRQEADIDQVFAQARSRFGGVDVLVNNAGLGYEAPLLTGETAAWREMLDVNVLALSIATRLAVADMRRRDAVGHIIHLSSLAAHRVTPGAGFYSASKFAVRALTEALRQELRAIDSPIRVTAISPGYVETEFHAQYYQDEAKARALYTRFQVLSPEDVASAVIWALASPAHVQVHDILLRSTPQPL